MGFGVILKHTLKWSNYTLNQDNYTLECINYTISMISDFSEIRTHDLQLSLPLHVTMANFIVVVWTISFPCFTI